MALFYKKKKNESLCYTREQEILKFEGYHYLPPMSSIVYVECKQLV